MHQIKQHTSLLVSETVLMISVPMLPNYSWGGMLTLSFIE